MPLMRDLRAHRPQMGGLEARFAVEAACLPLAAKRRQPAHLRAMRAEIAHQRHASLSDEDFCASDVRFHQSVAEATGNCLLAVQAAGVIEAIEPLMNMLTYRTRDRGVIAEHHAAMADALERRDAGAAGTALDAIARYVGELAAMRIDGAAARA
ncbi:MAG: FCD domain-containing protein [Pseudomonadota bacterium]